MKRTVRMLLGALCAGVALAPAGRAWGGSPITATTNGTVTLLVRSDALNNHVGRFSAGLNAAGALLYGYPLGAGKAHTTVRIDGTDYVFGDQAWGSAAVSVPTPGTVVTMWSCQGVQVTQTLIASAFPPGSQAQHGVFIGYQAVNSSGSARSVGFRLFLDFKVGAEELVVCAAPGQGNQVLAETSWSGNSAPNQVWVHDKWPNPGTSSRWKLSGPGLTSPDSLTVASSLGTATSRTGLRRSQWVYTPGPLTILQGGGAATWNPATLANGASRSVATFYGAAPGTTNGGLNGGQSDAAAWFPHPTGAFPNPARERAVIAFPNERGAEVRVRLHSLDGAIVLDRTTRGRMISLDLSGVRAGIYAWTAVIGRERIAKGVLAVR